jgi:LysR family transcriptional activator of nhaA
MARINYQHLFYFWNVAKLGSVTAAADLLHLAQPTISGQLAVFEQSLGVKLLRKDGRRLVLTDTGRAVFHYADEIFALGKELTHMLNGLGTERGMRLNIGVSDALPKLITYRLLQPVLSLAEPAQIQCTDDKTERLLTEMGLHAIDMMLSDVPATPAAGMRLFNHFLGESATAVYAVPPLAERYRSDFPRSLNGAPFLLPTTNTALRRSLDQWFDSRQISPAVQAEVEDSALLKTFAAAGAGLFFSPQAVAGEIERQYGADMLGIADGVVERFYAITSQRRMKHPLVAIILRHARHGVFDLLCRSKDDESGN